MSFCVYGIRLKGSIEVRYVGQTMHTPAHRLRSLRAEHGGYWGGEFHGSAFGRWLFDNAPDLEAFEIARCETREQAKLTEKTVIALCLRLEQRLFNADHVPSHLRLVA